MVMSGDGGDKKQRTNLNSFLSQYGVELGNNSVIRTNYYKYYHPKEVLISNGVVQEDFIRCANGEAKKSKKGKALINQMESERDPEIQEDTFGGFTFLYPFGTSLTVKSPAVAVLTSGTVSYPVNEALLAYYLSEGGGKLFAIGSWRIFSDGYFDKEENEKLINFVLENVVQGKETQFDPVIEEGGADFSKRKIIPNVEIMSEKIKNAL